VCLTHHLWSDLSDQIHDFLSGISLADLVARADVRQVAERQQLQVTPAERPVRRGVAV
jgi:Rrf2 family iron-sulfur cluster assembly transcriptional regulator